MCIDCKGIKINLNIQRLFASECSEVQDVQKVWSVDTILLRDTVFRHDSIIYRERTVLDTVYITKEVYRDRLHSTLNTQHSSIKDTVVVTKYRDRVVEHPPERYVPKFYKGCTIALWAVLALAIGYVCIKLKRKLNRS